MALQRIARAARAARAQELISGYFGYLSLCYEYRARITWFELVLQEIYLI